MIDQDTVRSWAGHFECDACCSQKEVDETNAALERILKKLDAYDAIMAVAACRLERVLARKGKGKKT